MAHQAHENSTNSLQEHDVNSTNESFQDLMRSIRKKPRRLKKDGTPYKPRKGWGPFRSVPNERAVAFNLQLDVQNLQQEIHNMTVLRDILRTKILLQRDSPDGSFAQVVSQFFHVFHKGVQLQSSGPPRLVAERYRGQQEFLRSVMDPDVDAGSGLFGPDVMMQQMVIYSTFLRFMCYRMHSLDIFKAEDSVVITTHSTLRFQILRQTIEKVFPHIMGNEWLVAQLLGKIVKPNVNVTFYFNDKGKCCKHEVDLDFVGAFASIVKDPVLVNMLLGRALISDNCMFGVVDEPPEPEDEEKPAVPLSNRAAIDSRASSLDSGAPPPFDPKLYETQTICLQAVEEYYRAFASGYQDEENVKSMAAFQRNFLGTRFTTSSTMEKYVEERWKAITQCFSVLGFHQKAVVSIDYTEKLSAIESTARYSLCITPVTIQLVFPHVAACQEIYDALIGEVLAVPSQILFTVETDAGRICSIEEQMNFGVALKNIIDDEHVLEFVLSESKLTLDGVSHRTEPTEMPRVLRQINERDCMPAKPRVARTRTMHVSDILN